MPVEVLPIEVASLEDLVRLTSNIRKERSVLISYTSNGKKYIGFYLPPQVKDVHGIFVHVISDDVPNVISYSPNDGGKEIFKFEYTESPLYVNVFVSKLTSSPHVFGELKETEVIHVDISDVRSFVHLAYSTSFEHLIVPFTWYIMDRNMFVMNVEVPSSSDDEDKLLIFRYRDNLNVDKPYLVYDPKEDSIGLADVPKDLSKKYVMVVKVKRFFIQV